jgi:hypothetical protein
MGQVMLVDTCIDVRWVGVVLPVAVALLTSDLCTAHLHHCAREDESKPARLEILCTACFISRT